jgi:hypothetical protein
MIGNELSLTELIKSQNRDLFDQSILTFHNSIDGSLEAFKNEINTQFVIHSQKGYPQSSVTTQMMRDAFVAGADICIPLDADEFLPFTSRNQLEFFLLPYVSKFDFIEIPWRNCFPSPFPISPMADNLKYAHAHSNVRKTIVFRSAFEKDASLRLSQGSHMIMSNAEMRGTIVSDNYLIHIPFRSQIHYARKMLQGAVVMYEENEHDLSDQWMDGAKRPFLTQEELMLQALDYGQDLCVKHSALYSQELFTTGIEVYNERDDVTSFNLVMEEYWGRISDVLASVPGTEFSVLEIKQIERRLKKQKLKQSIIKRVKQALGWGRTNRIEG